MPGDLPKPVNSPFKLSFEKKAGKQPKLRMNPSRHIHSKRGPSCSRTPKKHHVPPITIDNVSNQAGLLKHLHDLTKLKLEAKLFSLSLIGTKLRIFPQTAYAYHLIRKYVEENSLESYTYILPEEKKFRLVFRGLPTDMPPIEIIDSLAAKKKIFQLMSVT
ncbi:hypothetical protein TNCV_3135901 [Trichonephila clavipes]|nr:hypothetical protein TNCV_3135901 [Trichonephila clavipes]